MRARMHMADGLAARSRAPSATRLATSLAAPSAGLLLGGLLLGGLLAGCATDASTPSHPSSHRAQPPSSAASPAALVAERFSHTSPPGVQPPGSDAPSPVAVPDLPWDRFFTEPRLQALIRIALDHNRDLRIATLNVEQARAQAQAREADLWPTVNAALGGTRLPTNSGGISTTVTGGLATTAYEVDLFGRVRQQVSAAQAQLQASQALQAAARSSLIAAVAAAHLNLQADEALLELTRQTVRNREEGLRLAQGRVRAGAASALEAAQAEALLQAARVALAQVQRQRSIDESTLVLLLGRPLPEGLPPASTTPLPTLRADLPSAVLSRRPDVQAAEAQLRAARGNLEAARRALFPRITLTTSFGQASRELSNLFAGGNWVWGVAPQLLLPIFDGGRLRAGVLQADAAQQAALAQYERSIQVAFKEVHDALAARVTLDEQLQAQQAQARAEQERAALAETRWRLGASAYLEVLDAQRSLYAAQTGLIQTQTQMLLNQATLFKVLGGGAL